MYAFLRRIFTFAACALACVAAGAQSPQHSFPGRGAVSAQDVAKLTTAKQGGDAAADKVCARFASGTAVTDPPVLQSADGSLAVTMNFQTVTDARGLVRYCFVTAAGQESPTLVVNPGDTLTIHFQNQLPASTMAGMDMTLSPAASATELSCNGAMGGNVTNIHFHGTDIPPVCGQDEVVHTLVQPGASFDYNIVIPASLRPGLYWYHPHPHGISEGQVQGGATGALIVGGLQNVFPALAGMPTRTLVVRDQLLPASESTDSNIPAWDLSLNYVPVTYPAYTPAVINTLPAEKELWRVANTGADTILNLQYIVNGVAQPMQVYGTDGYALTSGAPVAQTTVQLGPGGRADFVVTTPNVGDVAQFVTAYQNTGPDGDYDPARPIANVVASASAPAAAIMPAQAGNPGTTLARSVAGLTPTAKRNLYFSEVLLDPANPDSPTTFYITEEGQTPAVFTMDQQPNIVVHAGTVEDWTIENRAGEDHIFHIHQLHFQVVAIDGVPVSDPALRDTMDVPYWSGSGPYHSITVRMDFSDPNVIGTFVYHCHILEHEDGGMMGEIQVLPAGVSASATVAASASSIAPNQSVTLTANVVDAKTGRPTPTGLVQFQVNGQNVGTPISLAGGAATLTTAVDGNTGANGLAAFYEGDSNYETVTSSAIPITISPFALTSPGVTAVVGSAAIATVHVNVADDFTSVITLSCTLPATLTQAACFVNPATITGTGTVQLTVNSTPPHPTSGGVHKPRGWWAAASSTSLACLALFFVPRRRRWRGMAISLVLVFTLALGIVGCGGASGSSSSTNPGSTPGTYMVVVTAAAGSGNSQFQTTVNVPVTLQRDAATAAAVGRD